MAFSQLDIIRFFDIFRSNESAYGVTIVGDMVNGKAEAKSHLEHSELTPVVMNRHLNGEISIGAAPLKEGNCVRWCAIDIDSYTGNLNDIIEAIYDFDIPLAPCFSKSKKLHVYCFFAEDTPAEDAVNLVKWYATMFRCDSKVEIFPKQTKVSANNRFYSWINLPYFDAASDNHRKCVKKDGSFMDLNEFIEYVSGIQLSLIDHKDRMKGLPYYGSPPCVQSGVLLRDIPPGTRNNWLYNVACFLRMDDEEADIVEPLLELNDTLHTPLAEREIHATVAKVASRSYFYQCNGMIGCNKVLCKSSDKGIGSDNSTKFNFGQLTKVMTDPIQWEWEINGQILRFHATEEIMNQNEFRKQCMEKLNAMPFKVKDEKWTAIIRRALDNVETRTEELYGNFGKGSQFLTVVGDYFGNKFKYTGEINDVKALGKMYVAEDSYQFSSMDFVKYLTDLNNVRMEQMEIRERLINLGAEHIEGAIWKMPKENIKVTQVIKTRVDYRDPIEEEAHDMGF